MGKHRCEMCDGFGFVSPKSRRWYEFWKSEPCAECDATGFMKPRGPKMPANFPLNDSERSEALDAMNAALNAVDLYCALMTQEQDLKAIRGLNEVKWKLQGAIDTLLANDRTFLNRFIGLEYEQALELAASRDMELLVKQIDGVSCTIPADDSPRRVRVGIDDGKVSKVFGLG